MLRRLKVLQSCKADEKGKGSGIMLVRRSLFLFLVISKKNLYVKRDNRQGYLLMDGRYFESNTAQ